MPEFFSQKIKADKETIEFDLLNTNTNFTDCLFIGGAGKFKKEIFHPLRIFFYKHKVSSVGFDFSGQGNSSGYILESSIQKRINEASAVYNYYFKNKPINIIAYGMGTHIASVLCSKIKNIKNLILFSPVAYTETAQEMKFSGGFSTLVNNVDSEDSFPSFNSIKKFNGGLLIFNNKNNLIIPPEIPEKYINTAVNSNKKYLANLDLPCDNLDFSTINNNKRLFNDIALNSFKFMYI